MADTSKTFALLTELENMDVDQDKILDELLRRGAALEELERRSRQPPRLLPPRRLRRPRPRSTSSPRASASTTPRAGACGRCWVSALPRSSLHRLPRARRTKKALPTSR